MAVTNKMVMDYTMRMGILETPQFKAGWGRVTKKMEKSLAPLFKKAYDAGFSPRQMAKLDQQFKKSTGELRLLFGKLQAVRETLALKGLDAEEKRRFEMIEAETKASIRAKTKTRKIDVKNANDMLARKKKAEADVGKAAKQWYGQGVQELGEGMHGVFQDVTSKDLPQMAGVLKRVGGQIEKIGKVAQSKEGMGALGKAMGSGGSMIAQLGKALGIIGAVVVGLAAIVGGLMKINNVGKEMNRTVMEAGVAGADLVDKFGDVSANLLRIRKTFAESFQFNAIWGTTAKDHFAILGAYAEAGMSFKMIAKNAKDAANEVAALREATSTVLTYSKLLSISSQEMTGHISGYMEDLGLSLQGVSEQFNSIVMAAQQSGYSTKKFFGQVLQATSGMSMYNVRLEEAGVLLMRLNKTLGQKEGGAALQRLIQGRKGEGVDDLTRGIFKTGRGRDKRISMAEAVRQIEDIRDKIEKSPAGVKWQLKDILGKAGLKDTMSPNEVIAHYSKMGRVDQAKLTQALIDVSPDLGRSIGNALEYGGFTQGGLGGQALARQGQGPGATLLSIDDSLRAVTKGSKFGEMSLSNLFYKASLLKDDESIALLKLATEGTNLSLEELRKHKKIMDSFVAQNAGLAEAQKTFQDKREKEGLQAARKWAKDNRVILAKKFGAYLNEDGKRVVAQMKDDELLEEETPRIISDSIDDLILNQQSFAKGSEEKVEENIRLAQQLVFETMDISKHLEIATDVLLSKIYNATSGIWSWLRSSTALGEKGKRAQATAVEQLSGKMEEYQRDIRNELEEVSKDRKKLEGAKGEEAKRIQAGIDIRHKRIAGLRGKIESTRGTLEGVRRISTLEDIGVKKGEEVTPEKFISRARMDTHSVAGMKTFLQKKLGEEAFAHVLAVAGDVGAGMAKGKKGKEATAAIAAGVDAMIDLAYRRETGELTKEEELLYQEKFQKKDFAHSEKQQKEGIKKFGRELKKIWEDSARSGAMAKLLESEGLDPMEADWIARAIGSGEGDIEGLLGEGRGELAKKLRSALGINTPETGGPGEDMMYKIGPNGEVQFKQRVGAGDLLAAVDPFRGGRGGAGGGAVMHNHFYQDGEGNWATLKKGLEALDIV